MQSLEASSSGATPPPVPPAEVAGVSGCGSYLGRCVQHRSRSCCNNESPAGRHRFRAPNTPAPLVCRQMQGGGDSRTLAAVARSISGACQCAAHGIESREFAYGLQVCCNPGGCDTRAKRLWQLTTRHTNAAVCPANTRRHWATLPPRRRRRRHHPWPLTRGTPRLLAPVLPYCSCLSARCMSTRVPVPVPRPLCCLRARHPDWSCLPCVGRAGRARLPWQQKS
jgi:hypothetical protein